MLVEINVEPGKITMAISLIPRKKEGIIMGRISTKKDKSIYQVCREELGFTREKASEMMDGMTASRIEKIENG